MQLRGSMLDRPTPLAQSFAQTGGLAPWAARAATVEGEAAELTQQGPLDQVTVHHADANAISHDAVPAIEQAGQQLEPGGRLLMTTGRALMGNLPSFLEQMGEQGFHTVGVIFQEQAYVAAEKDVLPGLGAISPEQSKLLLARSQFAGQPDAHAAIDGAGLAPRYTTSVHGRRVHLSQPFRCRGYQAALGYVEDKDGSLQARLFYQSKSQGVWRSASGQLGQILGKGPGGSFESSTTLPAAMQKTLSVLTSSVALVEGEQPVAFHAPLEKLNSEGGGSFDALVQATPFGKFVSERPESFSYDNPEQAPDFEKVQERFHLGHPTRGNLEATVVESKDGSARYLFLEDSEKRAWLGSVESTSELNSFLVPEKALELGSLTHPAIEYPQQLAQEYHGAPVVKEMLYNNITKTEEEVVTYVDATAYVSRLAPVQAFTAWRDGQPLSA